MLEEYTRLVLGNALNDWSWISIGPCADILKSHAEGREPHSSTLGNKLFVEVAGI